MKRKRIKAIISAVLACCTVAAAGTVVWADDDVLTPPQDGFYELYESQCELHDYRRFRAAVDFDVFASPIDQTSVRRVSTGEVISTNVSYVAPDGAVWGYAYSETGLGGWFRMENVTLVYDSIAFTEEHQNELTPYAGQLDSFSPKEYLYLWTYPGSGEAENICRAGDEWFTNGDVQNLGERAAYVYRDGSGSEWVYLDFLPSGWVYVPNPEADLRSGVPAANVNNNTNNDEELGDTIFEDIEAGASTVEVSANNRSAADVSAHALPLGLSAVLAAGLMAAKKIKKERTDE
ncbi:MAG: hypothetical protein K2K57_13565 [Oscillospiraceae bacterium]|nr:hypothetical protein [Oscillospiraceae bacterium]